MKVRLLQVSAGQRARLIEQSRSRMRRNGGGYHVQAPMSRAQNVTRTGYADNQRTG